MPRYHPYICERCSHAARDALSFSRIAYTFSPLLNYISLYRERRTLSQFSLPNVAYRAIQSYKNQSSPLEFSVILSDNFLDKS